MIFAKVNFLYWARCADEGLKFPQQSADVEFFVKMLILVHSLFLKERSAWNLSIY